MRLDNVDRFCLVAGGLFILTRSGAYIDAADTYHQIIGYVGFVLGSYVSIVQLIRLWGTTK